MAEKKEVREEKFHYENGVQGKAYVSIPMNEGTKETVTPGYL